MAIVDATITHARTASRLVHRRDRTHAAAPARPTAIPAFALYGEQATPAADMLHIEGLQSRSPLHQWEIEPHLHQGLHQVVWLRDGPAEVSLDGPRQACSGPLVVAIPPGTVHGFRFAPESDGQVLTLSPRALLEGDATTTATTAGAALQALFAQPRLLTVPAAEVLRIGALFDALSAEFNAPGSGGSPVPLWLARALVWRLAQLASQQDLAGGPAARGQQALFTRFLVLLEAHYAEHWPVARYAERLGMTSERLNRLVRAEAGRSALEIIHGRLTREACRRLVYVPAPVSRVCFDLGFDDPAYFCRFFKRRTGVSPRTYRQQSGG